MKLSPHNKLVLKLIKQGASDVQIRNEIRKVFGIHLELSQIQNKRTSELNSLITKFNENSKELLLPILYKGFPPRNLITEKLDQIFNYLLDAVEKFKEFPSENILMDLLLVFESKSNTFQHDALLYSLIYKYKKQKGQILEESDNIKRLKELMNNPFRSYFDMSNINMELISFKKESPEFNKIINEVCRDNIITPNERKYLEEKASEYFIEPIKLNRYLNNPFFGYESFKILIDQICEDGVITEIEREYIEEKANQYNVPLATMEEMINIGLIKSSYLKKLSNSKSFYEIVIFFLVAQAFDIDSVKNLIFEAMQSGKFNKPENIISIRYVAIDKLNQFFGNKTYALNKWQNASQLFEKLNIESIEIQEAQSIYNRYENDQKTLSFDQKKTSYEKKQETIYIDRLRIEDVEIIKRKNPVRPFDVTFLGSKITIEYSDEIDEIILVKALSVFYLKNSTTISKVSLLKQINRILQKLLNE